MRFYIDVARSAITMPQTSRTVMRLILMMGRCEPLRPDKGLEMWVLVVDGTFTQRSGSSKDMRDVALQVMWSASAKIPSTEPRHGAQLDVT